MSFACPILRGSARSVPCSRVEVALTVIGSLGEVEHTFRFDTGCDVTTVSEDVALGLPAGGPPVQLSGSTAAGVGRLVPVTFRFPPDGISGRPRPATTSTWAVVAGRTRLALLNFHEVDVWFYLGTNDAEMTFTDR